MNALSTMLLISDAFVELCDEMPLRKVSISDIVERTGKNRKTFYYHFENKDRLIIWIFRYDMGQCLKQHFSESVLLYDDDPEDPHLAIPLLYYSEVRRALARSRGVLPVLRRGVGGPAQLLPPGARGQRPLLAAQLPVRAVP